MFLSALGYSENVEDVYTGSMQDGIEHCGAENARGWRISRETLALLFFYLIYTMQKLLSNLLKF